MPEPGASSERTGAGTTDSGGGSPPVPAKVVDYVVVLHGMGAQRQNETLTQVISGFAAACNATPASGDDFPVSLGSTRPSSGRWVERAGIAPTGTRAGDWEDRDSDTGENVRFMEICWSEVTTSALGASAEAAPRWVRTVSRRIGRHDMALQRAHPGPEADRPRVPFWLTHLVRLVRPIVHLGMPALSLLNRRLAHDVFSEHLGDVQVYCEDPDVRGRAIRRVHDALARLHDAHFQRERKEARPGQPLRRPRITILAHSLGSVLALDALAVAHQDADRRRDIQGYVSGGLPPEVAWLPFVHALFTVGSPAEKVLALWPSNHDFHADARILVDAKRVRAGCGARRILHANFLEQMDVVGDPLALYRQSPLYQEIFDCGGATECLEWAYVEDPRPFIAHVNYWTDPELYRRIRLVAWAGERQVRPRPQGSDRRVWWWVHLYVPLLSSLLLALTASATLRAASFGSAALYSVAFVGALLLSVVSVRLLTWWWALILVRSPADTRSKAGILKAPKGGSRAPSDLGHFGPCVVVATIFSAAIGRLTGVAYQAEWLPPGLLLFGGLAAGCWLLARRAGETSGRPWMAVVSVLGMGALALGWMLALRHASYPAPPASPVYLGEVSLIAVLLTLSTWTTATLARLPPEALHLRRGGPRAVARSWGFMLLLWAAVYYLPEAAIACMAPTDLADACAPASVVATLRSAPFRTGCHALFLGSTALMCLFTIMRHERGLAAMAMDWPQWTKTKWRAYVTPSAQESVATEPLTPDAGVEP